MPRSDFAFCRKKPVAKMSRSSSSDRHGQVVLGLAVLDEEILRDAVDVHVGRLRREHHRDEQLERAAERERDRGIGVLDRKPLDHRPHARPLRPDPPARLVDVAPRHPRDGSAAARRSRLDEP